MLGDKNHVGIDRRHGQIRTWTATDAARHDGVQLSALLDETNTGSAVWADTAYRSLKNEAHLAAKGFTSRIHRKKPKASRCRSTSPAPTPPSPRSAPMSSMSSPARKEQCRW